MSRHGAPSVWLLIGELRALWDWLRARLRPRAHNQVDVGGGQPVITIPGFLAGDISMAQMRANLRAAGFRAHGWRMGINRGARADILDRLDARVTEIAAREGRPPALVGWSLGGIYAREYAKRFPERVHSVVTMGTPFSGSRRANNAWRLYRIVAGHDVEDPPIMLHDAPKPAVPTYALWSRHDGVVAPDSARGLAEESDAAIECDCVHLAFAFVPQVTAVVIDCLTREKARQCPP
jgi:pimeloyl-ACP methyl ester carboxylesterase